MLTRLLALLTGAAAAVLGILMVATATRPAADAIPTCPALGAQVQVDSRVSTMLPGSSWLTVPLAGDEQEGAGEIDIQGDEVNPAVATYVVDAHGNLYEIHSPHMEVPRLGAPSS